MASAGDGREGQPSPADKTPDASRLQPETTVGLVAGADPEHHNRRVGGLAASGGLYEGGTKGGTAGLFHLTQDGETADDALVTRGSNQATAAHADGPEPSALPSAFHYSCWGHST